MLSANNAMATNFLFNSHPDFIFCRPFICLWSLGKPKKCLRGRFRTDCACKLVEVASVCLKLCPRINYADASRKRKHCVL